MPPDPAEAFATVDSLVSKTRNSVPHITDAIQDWIEQVALVPVDESGTKPDICVVELGESRRPDTVPS